MSKAEQMMKDWLQHRNVLEELLELIDDEHIDFKPWADAIELGELALHVAGWNDVFSRRKNFMYRTYLNVRRWQMYEKL